MTAAEVMGCFKSVITATLQDSQGMYDIGYIHGGVSTGQSVNAPREVVTVQFDPSVTVTVVPVHFGLSVTVVAEQFILSVTVEAVQFGHVFAMVPLGHAHVDLATSIGNSRRPAILIIIHTGDHQRRTSVGPLQMSL